MRFIFITLFPDMIRNAASESILGRAQQAGLLSVSCINPRDFAMDRHRSVDDTPCGGGAGMVLKPTTYLAALKKAKTISPHALVLALTPAGEKLQQTQVCNLASSGQDLIFCCGHYEGFDERILSEVDLRACTGDFVLTGGELPALSIMDAVARFLPGVLGKESSAQEDSFSKSLLEYPQYTRPVTDNGQDVPAVLLSGDHEKIAAWRMKEALKMTLRYRPELLRQCTWQTGNGKLFLQAAAELAAEKQGKA